MTRSSLPSLLRLSALLLLVCSPLLLSLSEAGAAPASGFVRELTDATFEHDTQASTGGTTGDWFIQFYAPWCGHCKTLSPVWTELSVRARESLLPVTLAQLDATAHVRTAKRFDIRGFPSLRLVSRGRVHEYSGARTLDAMLAWLEARPWEQQQGSGVPVPVEVSALSAWTTWVRESGSEAALLAWSKPAAASTLALMGLLLGILISMVVFIACFEPKPIIYQVRDDAVPQQRAGTGPLPLSKSTPEQATADVTASLQAEAAPVPATNAKNKKAQ